MAIDFYDTSAILAQGSISDYSYISHFVISELEEIKNSSYKDDSIKQKARAATRALISNTTIQTHNVDLRKVEKIRKKYNFLPDNMDGRIIAEAILLQKRKGVPVNFWTADGNMRLFCQAIGLAPYFVGEEEKINAEPWAGWSKYYPSDEEMASLYSNPKINILGAKNNEYCQIFTQIDSKPELKDILKWNGEEYVKLRYKTFKSPLEERIEPKNLLQKCAFDALQDDNTTVKLIYGRVGSGKDYIMLAHALWMIEQGKYDKLVFVRNNIRAKDTEEIGFLKGTELDKAMPWLAPLRDHLGFFKFQEYIDQEIIEPQFLGFLRGRSIKNSIIYISEGQNLSSSNMRLLLGRVDKGSTLWMNADFKQVDRKLFSQDSGIRRMLERLDNEKLLSVVKLTKTERSKTAELADLLE